MLPAVLVDNQSASICRGSSPTATTTTITSLFLSDVTQYAKFPANVLPCLRLLSNKAGGTSPGGCRCSCPTYYARTMAISSNSFACCKPCVDLTGPVLHRYDSDSAGGSTAILVLLFLPRSRQPTLSPANHCLLVYREPLSTTAL